MSRPGPDNNVGGADGRTEVVRIDEAIPRPWRNGAGTTRQLFGESNGSDGFAWRISVADVVEDGPFSMFPGVDRTLLVAQGAGMRLTIAGEVREAGPHEVLAFPGESETSAALEAGPIRVLNVMTTRTSTRALLRVHRGDTKVDIEDGRTTILVALDDDLVVHGSDGAPVQCLGRLDALRLGGPGQVRLSGEGSYARIELTSIGPTRS